MPADGTFAACCNDQDFGTSRFSSSLGQNTPLAEIEKGWESTRPTSHGVARSIGDAIGGCASATAGELIADEVERVAGR